MPELTVAEVREVCDQFAGEVEVVSGGSVEGLPEPVPFDSAASRNIILYGPPGTGKTYRTANLALELLDVDVDINDRQAVTEAFRLATSSGSVAFVTFHQSYSYEDFVEGIRPVLTDHDEASDWPIESFRASSRPSARAQECTPAILCSRHRRDKPRQCFRNLRRAHLANRR